MPNVPLNRPYLQAQYWDAGRSLADLAAEKGCSKEAVRRAIVRAFGRTRNKSEAMRLALRQGRATHPTQGRARTAEERLAIGAGVRAGLTAADRAARRARGRAWWAALPEADRALFGLRGADGLARARARGSRLELGLARGLRARGYEAWHRPRAHPGDLYLPAHNCAVFVDGRLTLTGAIDPGAPDAAAARRDLARNLGYSVVRVVARTDSPSPAAVAELLTKIVTVLELELAKNSDSPFVHEVHDGEEEGPGDAGGD